MEVGRLINAAAADGGDKVTPFQYCSLRRIARRDCGDADGAVLIPVSVSQVADAAACGARGSPGDGGSSRRSRAAAAPSKGEVNADISIGLLGEDGQVHADQPFLGID